MARDYPAKHVAKVYPTLFDYADQVRAPGTQELARNSEVLMQLASELCRSQRVELPGSRIKIAPTYNRNRDGTYWSGDYRLTLYTPGTAERVIARKWLDHDVGGIYIIANPLWTPLINLGWKPVIVKTADQGAVNISHLFPPSEVCEDCSMRLTCFTKRII